MLIDIVSKSYPSLQRRMCNVDRHRVDIAICIFQIMLINGAVTLLKHFNTEACEQTCQCVAKLTFTLKHVLWEVLVYFENCRNIQLQ